MKAPTITGTVFVSLLLAVTTAYAQHGQQGEKQGSAEQTHQAAPQQQRQAEGQPQHQPQQQARPQHTQPAQPRAQQAARQPQQQRQAQQQPQRHEPQAQQPQHGQPQPPSRLAQQSRPAANSSANRPRTQIQRTQEQRNMQQREQRSAWQQHRANGFDAQHRTWQQRGGYDGYRVPDNYFRAHYGRGHYFHVYSLPFAYVGGYPRFQYEGYWFSAMDPYPEYWGDNWYQTDEVYVDYVDNGYYLFNRRYPGRPGIAISISM